MPDQVHSPKLIRKKKRRAKPKHRELLVIASFFLVMGLLMLLARSGRLVPLPADHKGAAPELAAVNAEDMRAYGWLGLFVGLGIVGWYYYLVRQDKKQAEKLPPSA